MQNVLLPVVPTLALGKLDRPMNYGSSAVPIFLTIRGLSMHPETAVAKLPPITRQYERFIGESVVSLTARPIRRI
jgi:hypothetical protein